MNEVKYPFGDADIQSVNYSANIELEIDNQETIVTIAQMTGAVALTADIAEGVKPGARLTVIAPSDGTARTITPGAGFSSASIAGVISKTKAISFVFNGTVFVNTGAIQID